ncbi:MAG: transposase [Acidobacteriota bacterium]
MARNPRYLPRPGAVIEITQRTIQGRFLLKPSRRLNAVVAGCLARAQKNTGATVHAVAVLSNHFHLLASFTSVQQMASFVGQLKTNISKEVGRLHNWKGSLFDGRYSAVPLSDEPKIQLKRLRYVLSQGAKEGLVLSPLDWPGVHSARALVNRRKLRGVWVNRTDLYAARQRNPKTREDQFTEQTELQLTALPCLAHLSAKEQKRVVQDMILAIEKETLERHRRSGTAPAGAEAVTRRRAHDRPKHFRPMPRPHFHASKELLRVLTDGFRLFLTAYRRAADRLAAGELSVVFPDNCFPPRCPSSRP